MYCAGVRRLATVAVALRVDDVAAESHQRYVLAGQIQSHRRDLEALDNPPFILVADLVVEAVLSLTPRGGQPHTPEADGHRRS